MEAITAPKAPPAIGPYSHAVKHCGLLFCSGAIALDPASGELKNQTLELEVRQVFANIQAVLESQKLSLANVIKTTLFIRDMGQFAEINKIYGEYFKIPYPARSTVEVSRLPKNVNIEIEVIAGYPEGKGG